VYVDGDADIIFISLEMSGVLWYLLCMLLFAVVCDDISVGSRSFVGRSFVLGIFSLLVDCVTMESDNRRWFLKRSCNCFVLCCCSVAGLARQKSLL
jgi:hypothetical protein